MMSEHRSAAYITVREHRSAGQRSKCAEAWGRLIQRGGLGEFGTLEDMVDFVGINGFLFEQAVF